MSLPKPLHALLNDLSFLPRVSTHDGRAIEEACKGTLFDQGVQLNGAIVEASYAARDPELLRRLRATLVPFLVDTHSLRFAGEGFLDVARITDLPFAPDAPIGPQDLDAAAARSLAHDTMVFANALGAAAYLAPGLPIPDAESARWLDVNRRVLEGACELNGTGDTDQRPLVAMIAPGRKALKDPDQVLAWLPDLPVSAVYVQPLNLDPVKDSFEKLALYVEYLRAFSDAGLTVVAGRVGAFGLVLQALGVPAFDSGLGDAERYSHASQARRRKPRPGGSPTGGRDRRVYLEQLKTTLPSRYADPLLAELGVRARFTCQHACCVHRGFEDLAERRRPHYLWTRDAEVAALRALPTASLRISAVHEQLRTAREHGQVVRRALFAKGIKPPAFEHLDRWIAVLGRHQAASLGQTG